MPPKSAILKLIDAAVLKTLLAVDHLQQMTWSVRSAYIDLQDLLRAEAKEIARLNGDIMLTHIRGNTVILPVRALTDNVGNPTAVNYPDFQNP